MHTISLPAPKNSPSENSTVTLDVQGSLVVVGANGSGKTRLGSWIEFSSEHGAHVRRISAQKSISMPSSVSSIAAEQALHTLLIGSNIDPQHRHPMDINQRRSHRWRNNPVITPLNDFEQLLTYLFSDNNESNAKYVELVWHEKRQGQPFSSPFETKLLALQRIWQATLPHRKLHIGSGDVKTSLLEGSESKESAYNASEMSDGERVTFYLIGQALSAPENGMIVVDEPELHLHRSIQTRLWDAIETERSDCLFVYLTHDLDFAASRVSSTTIWLESYDGGEWKWREVEQPDGIPEQLYLEILGGRKPVLFCEGDKGSLDYFVLQKAFPDFTIAPCGNADGVIQAAIAFSNLNSLHSLECRGIIDRDFRSDGEVSWLASKNVLVLEYSEIENVLLSERVLEAVATQMQFFEFSKKLETVKGMVFDEMSKDKDRLVSSITAAKVEQRLKKPRNFDSKVVGKSQLRAAMTGLTTSIDVEAMYDQTEAHVDRVLVDRDYEEALRLYNNKGLLGKIEPQFGLAHKGMVDLIKRLASSKEGVDMTLALKQQLPDSATH